MKNLQPMSSPVHPGEFITETYLKPLDQSARGLAVALGVTPSTLQRILSGLSGVSPEMALRLSFVLGRSPESWLAMQDAHDLWKAKQRIDLSNLKPFVFAEAS